LKRNILVIIEDGNLHENAPKDDLPFERPADPAIVVSFGDREQGSVATIIHIIVASAF
jgi:hypothetical protein